MHQADRSRTRQPNGLQLAGAFAHVWMSSMLWPFSLIKTSRSPMDRTIETIYGAIVAQARRPVFYRHFEVPDSVDGRFDLLVLHLWLVLRQWRDRNESELPQALVDRFCSDMDHNLRELGVGDLTVPKRMVKFGEALYGRARAYDAALEAGGEALAQALDRNIYNERNAAAAVRLAKYVAEAAAVDEIVTDGVTRFPEPAV